MNPFSDPGFRRHVHIVPFDQEADAAAEMFRIEQASYAFRMRCERLRRRQELRQAGFALIFALICLGCVFLGASL